MSEETDKINNGLKGFGLESDDIKVYLCLLENRELSALDVSREVGIARTKVYRILDRLIAKRLVILKQASSGFRFVADEPAKIENLLMEREVELEELKNNLPLMIEKMNNLAGEARSGSKVLYYQGQKGLSQVNWNLVNAKGEFLSYEVATADAYLPHLEAEKLRVAITEKKIMIRTITNKEMIEPFTKVTGLVRDCWQVKNIDKDILNITEDVFIYNDVYAWCQYLGGGEVFCVEIYNQRMADMQRQLFEQMWKIARMMKVVSDEGEVRLV